MQEHEQQVAAIQAEVAAQNDELDALQRDFDAGKSEAVMNFFALVLDHSHYPSDFPQDFRLAYVPESKQLVVEYDFLASTLSHRSAPTSTPRRRGRSRRQRDL
jgi:restriction system protein